MAPRDDGIQKRYLTVLVPVASAIDHIAVELFFIVLAVPTLVVAAIGVPIAGLMLLCIHKFWMKKRITILPAEWKNLIIVSALFAVTEFTWFDAIGRIGAGKTALLNIPLEPIAVIILAFLILDEKLHRPQIIGSCIVLVGVILSINVVPSNVQQLGIGEIESIVASLSAAIQLVLVTKLLYRYNTMECTAFVLILSGLMLNVIWVFNPVTIEPASDWFWLLLFPFIPMILFLIFYSSMNKIGASLTSILWSSSIVLTLVLQLIIVEFGIPLKLPHNMTLAVAGGVISIVGIYVIFNKQMGLMKETKNKRS